MADGTFWPIPITLSTTKGQADSIKDGEEVALFDENNEIMATMTVAEKYTIDKAYECKKVFRTTDTEHPGVAKVMEQAEVNLAGPVKVLSQGSFPTEYKGIYMRPAETRKSLRTKAGTGLPRSRHGTRCTAPTSFWQRSRLTYVTASISICSSAN